MQMKTSATVPNVMLDPAIVRYIQFLRDDVYNLNEQVRRLEDIIKEIQIQLAGAK